MYIPTVHTSIINIEIINLAFRDLLGKQALQLIIATHFK